MVGDNAPRLQEIKIAEHNSGMSYSYQDLSSTNIS